MSSSNDIQRTYALLQQIEALLRRINVETETTKQKITDVVVQAEIAERTLSATARLIRRISGDDRLDPLLTQVQRGIALINQMQIAATMLMTTNPWLMALGAVSYVAVLADITGCYQ